jgi:hypothetical protein
MARHTTAAIYGRDRDGKYHKCDLRGVYPRNDTTFVLRYEAERDRSVWEKLPAGTDYSAARRMALEKELALSAVKLPGAKAPASKPAPVPGRTGCPRSLDTFLL